MRIATWNLGYWQFSRYHEAAWPYLREYIRPDVALLQEVAIPALTDDEIVIFSPIRKPWGTALYVKGMPVDRLATKQYPSRVAAGIVRIPPSGRSVCAVSVHAPIINRRVFPLRANSFHAFQDDHLLATPALAERLVSCDVLLNDTTRRVSDHIPLVATFELS